MTLFYVKMDHLVDRAKPLARWINRKLDRWSPWHLRDLNMAQARTLQYAAGRTGHWHVEGFIQDVKEMMAEKERACRRFTSTLRYDARMHGPDLQGYAPSYRITLNPQQHHYVFQLMGDEYHRLKYGLSRPMAEHLAHSFAQSIVKDIEKMLEGIAR